MATAVGRCMPADSARPPGGGGGAAADDGTATGGNSGAASVVNSVGAGGRQRLPANEQTVLHAYASLHEANTVALDAEHLGGGVDAVVEVVEEAEGAAAALREDAQRALASAADAAASGGGCYGKSHAEAWAESAALEQWADELEELAELAAAAEDADGSDQDEPKSARTSTASCELPLSSRYARVIGDVQDAVYRADDRQRGDIPRLAAHRGHSFKMLSDRATATAAAAAAAAASAAVAASVAVAAIAAAAAPPGEAILARTDATGAGAGVEGAYEAEMMEALAACGD